MARKKTTPAADAAGATQQGTAAGTDAQPAGAAAADGAAEGADKQGDSDSDSGGVEQASQGQGQAEQVPGSDAADQGRPGEATSEAATQSLSPTPGDGRQPYAVISPLELDGTRYEIGETVRLTDVEAKPLQPHTVAPVSAD